MRANDLSAAFIVGDLHTIAGSMSAARADYGSLVEAAAFYKERCGSLADLASAKMHLSGVESTMEAARFTQPLRAFQGIAGPTFTDLSAKESLPDFSTKMALNDYMSKFSAAETLASTVAKAAYDPFAAQVEKMKAQSSASHAQDVLLTEKKRALDALGNIGALLSCQATGDLATKCLLAGTTFTDFTSKASLPDFCTKTAVEDCMPKPSAYEKFASSLANAAQEPMIAQFEKLKSGFAIRGR